MPIYEVLSDLTCEIFLKINDLSKDNIEYYKFIVLMNIFYKLWSKNNLIFLLNIYFNRATFKLLVSDLMIRIALHLHLRYFNRLNH